MIGDDVGEAGFHWVLM